MASESSIVVPSLSIGDGNDVNCTEDNPAQCTNSNEESIESPGLGCHAGIQTNEENIEPVVENKANDGVNCTNSIEKLPESPGLDCQDEIHTNEEKVEQVVENKTNDSAKCNQTESSGNCDKMTKNFPGCDKKSDNTTTENVPNNSAEQSISDKNIRTDTLNGCCGSKQINMNERRPVLKNDMEDIKDKSLENGNIKFSNSDENNSEHTEQGNSQEKEPSVGSNQTHVEIDNEDNPKSNPSGDGKRLSYSSPNLCMPSEQLPAARHGCLQKSHSEERSADLPQEKLYPKSTSCMDLSRPQSLDKESQTKFLFRRVKRVVSNSGAIKNYQMLYNASVEVLAQNSTDVLSPCDAYATFHTTSVDQLGTRVSVPVLSSQSIYHSQPEIVLPSSSFRVLKIEPHRSIEDSSNTHLRLPDSPNSAKYRISGEPSSPALSTRSLNIAIHGTPSQSHSSSDDVFRVCHHSLDKTTKLRPKRKSKKSTSSDKMRETQKAVSFKEQPLVPTGVSLANSLVHTYNGYQ